MTQKGISERAKARTKSERAKWELERKLPPFFAFFFFYFLLLLEKKKMPRKSV